MHINIQPYLSHLTHSRNELPSVLKANALEKYNKLIEILLKVYPAPVRERKYREYSTKKNKKANPRQKMVVMKLGLLSTAWSLVPFHTTRKEISSAQTNTKRL
jgi:hypothetical protein